MFRSAVIALVAAPIVLAISPWGAQAAQASKPSSTTPCDRQKSQNARWDFLLSRNDLVGQAVEKDVKEIRQHPRLWALMKGGLRAEQAIDQKFPMPRLGTPNYAGKWMHRQNERCAAITHYRVVKGLLPSNKAYPEEDQCFEFASGIWYSEWKASRKVK